MQNLVKIGLSAAQFLPIFDFVNVIVTSLEDIAVFTSFDHSLIVKASINHHL